MAQVSEPDNPVAGIPRDDLYQITQAFLDQVQSQGLGLHGLRLAHLIAHAICRKVPDWRRLTVDQPLDGDSRECLVFRRFLGLERSKGNKSLEHGIAQLSQTSLFDFINFANENHWLEWRLRDEVFELLFGSEPYGYFNIRDLAKFRRPLDLMLWGDLSIVRRMRRPEVSLALDGYAASLGRAPEWHRMQADIVRALQRSAELLECGCVVLLECRGARRGVDTMTVRLRAQHTRWSWKSLTASSEHYPARKVLLLDHDTCEQADRTDPAETASQFFS
ncbi:hypothetical protein [Palleronia sp.]|uniref:hypothetical protein n=1 Tax=Palleronia sp. TaxID=1940284 RepID=UPI0035C7CDDF